MMMRPTLMAAAMLTAGLLAVPAQQAFAFQPLPTTGADIRVLGAQDVFSDPLFLGPGWNPTSQGYTQIHFSEQEIELDGEDVGTFYDAVFRNNIDGTLLFGSRVVVFEDDDDGAIGTLAEEEEDEFELNHTQRNGFLGYTTAAGWYRDTPNDLRAYAAAATSTFYDPDESIPLNSSFYDGNSVTFYSDISAEEGNPVSAWYVVKTNATAFAQWHCSAVPSGRRRTQDLHFRCRGTGARAFGVRDDGCGPAPVGRGHASSHAQRRLKAPARF